MLSEALPDKPTVVVKNVPGAGSTKGANEFAQVAEPLLLQEGLQQSARRRRGGDAAGRHFRLQIG